MNADAPLSAQVAAALGGLGTDSAEIAQALENKGIRGVALLPDSCPVAVYLRQQFPEVEEVHVFTADVLVGDSPYVQTPKAIQEFIYAFDHGDYPNLVSS